MGKVIGIVTVAFTAALVIFLQVKPLSGQSPVEEGQVQWNRDLGQALTESRESGKPLFVQFQEVPG